MATTTAINLQPTNATDAHFRAWITFVRDALLAGGWVQTADSGQINFATVSAPGVANTLQGSATFRMNDSLQATHPVYLQLGFGSGTGSANRPRIRVSMGLGSDGSNNLTDPFLAGQDLMNSLQGTTIATICHGSSSPSHAAITLFSTTAAGSYGISFSIERARTDAGAEDGRYIVFMHSVPTTGATVGWTRHLDRTGVSGPTLEAIPTVLTSSPSSSGGTHFKYASLSDVGFGLSIPVTEVEDTSFMQGARFGSPVLGYIFIPVANANPAYIVLESVVTVYIYGVPHTFRRLLSQSSSLGTTVNTGGVSVWQRFE